MDIAVDANILDNNFHAGASPLYREKRVMRAQLIQLCLLSFGYTTSVGFRNAVSASVMHSSVPLSQSSDLANYSNNRESQDITVTGRVVQALWLYCISMTVCAFCSVLFLSVILGRANASQYIVQYKQEFRHWNTKQQKQAENEKETKKKIWLDATVLSSVWRETVTSARGKAMHLMNICFGFTTAMAWKDSSIGLILHLYHKGALRLASLWIYTFGAILSAVVITGVIYRQFNHMEADLRRSLESYRSWAASDEKGVKQPPGSSSVVGKAMTKLTVPQSVVMLAEVLEETEQKKKENDSAETAKQYAKEQEEKKEKERISADLASSQARSKMFVKEEIWYRVFPFMDIMMTFFSALSCRDTINITLLSLGIKPESSLGIEIQWIYAVCMLLFGLVVAVLVVWRIQKYSQGIRSLQKKCVRLEYLYRMQEHRKEYRKEYRKLTSSNLRSQYMGDTRDSVEPPTNQDLEKLGDNAMRSRSSFTEEKQQEDHKIETEAGIEMAMRGKLQREEVTREREAQAETETEADAEASTEIKTKNDDPLLQKSSKEADGIALTNGHEDDMFTPAMHMDNGVMRPTWTDSPKARRSLPMRQMSVNVNNWYNHFKYESEPDLIVTFNQNDLFAPEPDETDTLHKEKQNGKSEENDDKPKEQIKNEMAYSSFQLKKQKKEKEIENEKLVQEIREIEKKIISLKLKKHGFSILVAGLSFICGLGLYDAANESFHRALRHSKIHLELSLFIFALLSSSIAVTCILYLDKMTTAFVSFLKKLSKLEKSRPRDEDKSNSELNESITNDNWRTTFMTICRCCSGFYHIQDEENGMSTWTRKQLKKKRREQMQNIEITLLFGRYIANVVSLITAISYVAFVEAIFKLIFRAENGEIWATWVFFILHLSIAVVVATTLAKFEPKKKK